MLESSYVLRLHHTWYDGIARTQKQKVCGVFNFYNLTHLEKKSIFANFSEEYGMCSVFGY